MSKVLTDEIIPALKSKVLSPTPIALRFTPKEGITINRNASYRIDNLAIISLWGIADSKTLTGYDYYLGKFDVGPLSSTELSVTALPSSLEKIERAAFSTSKIIELIIGVAPPTTVPKITFSISGVAVLTE